MEIILGIIALVLIFDSSPTESTVILLDNNKTKNAITIASDSSHTTLDKTNTYITLENNSTKTPKVKQISKENLDKKYGNIIKYSKNKPISILYYFKSGTTVLTPESKANLHLIQEAIDKKGFCAVTIIGHSDRLGSDELNIKLSLKRANSMRKYISSNKVKELKVESYGENDPIIPTADNVAEPKNRRVEILVR